MSLTKVMIATIVLGVAARAQTDEWSSLYLRASNLRQVGRYAEAAALYREAALAAEQTSHDTTHAAWARNCLAMIDDEMGRVSEAEDEYRRSLALLERAGANYTSDYALVLANLAAHYLDLDHLVEAETLLRESIAVFEAAVPPSTAGLALARGSLAVLMIKEKDYTQAEVLLTQAVSGLENQPAQALRLAFELNNMGLLRKRQSRCQEAAALFRRALAILDRELGTDHPLLLDPLNNLALVEWEDGNRVDADALFRRALAIARALGADTRMYGQILMNYSAVLRKEGEKSGAKKLERQGRAILQRSADASGTAFTVDVSALR